MPQPHHRDALPRVREAEATGTADSGSAGVISVNKEPRASHRPIALPGGGARIVGGRRHVEALPTIASSWPTWRTGTLGEQWR